MTHICVRKLTITGSDNGLSPGRRQAIIWINVGILLIRTLGTNFSEILSEIHAFSFKKMHLKMSSAKWRPFSLGLNVLKWPKLKLSDRRVCANGEFTQALVVHQFGVLSISGGNHWNYGIVISLAGSEYPLSTRLLPSKRKLCVPR